MFFIVAAIAPVFTDKLAQNEPFEDLLAVQSALLNEEGVIYSSITIGMNTFSTEENPLKTTTYVAAQAILSSNKVGDTEYAQRLALSIIEHYPEAMNKGTLKITLTYGYDIGIWSQWLNYTHDFDPAELVGIEQE